MTGAETCTWSRGRRQGMTSCRVVREGKRPNLREAASGTRSSCRPTQAGGLGHRDQQEMGKEKEGK